MAINQALINKVTKSQKRLDHPDFKPGDKIRVQVKITDSGKERIQNFEGIVMKIQNAGASKSFTVRKESFSVGVEKTFMYNSPSIAKIQLVKHGKVRRARIFYMRERSGKAARIKDRDLINQAASQNLTETKPVKETKKVVETKQVAAEAK